MSAIATLETRKNIENKAAHAGGLTLAGSVVSLYSLVYIVDTERWLLLCYSAGLAFGTYLTVKFGSKK